MTLNPMIAAMENAEFRTSPYGRWCAEWGFIGLAAQIGSEIQANPDAMGSAIAYLVATLSRRVHDVEHALILYVTSRVHL